MPQHVFAILTLGLLTGLSACVAEASGSPVHSGKGATEVGEIDVGGVGVRVSLHEVLAARWTGERRSIAPEGDTVVFKGLFEAGKFGGREGHTVQLKLRPGREYLFEYRIRFDRDFPWTKGGKIPGLAGGTAPTGCVAADGGGFSARMMWQAGGRLVGYVYDLDQRGNCGNVLDTGFTFKTGQWYSIKQRAKINSGGKHDGVLQVWVDDHMVINRTDLAYMDESPTNRIDRVLFHSFFGGSTQAWAPSRECSISFADPYVTMLAE
jgi:hypothetical protein